MESWQAVLLQSICLVVEDEQHLILQCPGYQSLTFSGIRSQHQLSQIMILVLWKTITQDQAVQEVQATPVYTLN